ncbi:hypothetical protein [Spartinivicinus ruber]|uniref:hypothetical protein n=1 Tax=Spartinivicinus ruber TaxID=2683272 RepID=UPI001CA3B714|nr:hypothetical protein [Spartinivicinus ruber]
MLENVKFQVNKYVYLNKKDYAFVLIAFTSTILMFFLDKVEIIPSYFYTKALHDLVFDHIPMNSILMLFCVVVLVESISFLFRGIVGKEVFVSFNQHVIDILMKISSLAFFSALGCSIGILVIYLIEGLEYYFYGVKIMLKLCFGVLTISFFAKFISEKSNELYEAIPKAIVFLGVLMYLYLGIDSSIKKHTEVDYKVALQVKQYERLIEYSELLMKVKKDSNYEIDNIVRTALEEKLDDLRKNELSNIKQFK